MSAAHAGFVSLDGFSLLPIHAPHEKMTHARACCQWSQNGKGPPAAHLLAARAAPRLAWRRQPARTGDSKGSIVVCHRAQGQKGSKADRQHWIPNDDHNRGGHSENWKLVLQGLQLTFEGRRPSFYVFDLSCLQIRNLLVPQRKEEIGKNIWKISINST